MSKNSIKTLTLIANFIIQANQPEQPIFRVKELLDSLVEVFGKFPQDILRHVKNMSLYIDYLDALKIMINFLGFMFKRMPRGTIIVSDYFVENFATIFSTKINIIRNLPQMGSQSIRKELLNYIK